jgi:hypothetical protein
MPSLTHLWIRLIAFTALIFFCFGVRIFLMPTVKQKSPSHSLFKVTFSRLMLIPFAPSVLIFLTLCAFSQVHPPPRRAFEMVMQ